MKILKAITGRSQTATDSSTTRAKRARSTSVRTAARKGQEWEDQDRANDSRGPRITFW
ncbi:hypothetical protein [Streptomyces sp. G1]|uniref:hypothetical protein n=1 Tax=Streptomyces sp. G1 TaxID=361572 RepID=UPI00203056A6|nr:hypothetical protein [Streptomyces sp. G1]MCM1964885.1 hypothetical protein [Streptomyces sp. G1]